MTTITQTITVTEDGKLTLDILSPDLHKGETLLITVVSVVSETAAEVKDDIDKAAWINTLESIELTGVPADCTFDRNFIYADSETDERLYGKPLPPEEALK